MTARPDPEQERALASTARHLVVVAPPGTGKTSLAARLAATYASGLPSHERVLLLTFSNQARGELEREVTAHVPSSLRRQVEVTNYHRFFWRLVLTYRRALGLPPDIKMTSRKRREALIRGATRRHADLGALDESAEYAFADLRTSPIDPDDLRKVLEVIGTEHAAGRLVFGDLGALWKQLITSQPSVREALRARYRVVIADEHQDASAVQEALVRELGARLTVFADPMQLIHAWRGADWARLEQHLRECEEHIELVTPHRWHDSPILGQWLLDVRGRLQGETRPGQRPAQATVTLTDPHHGRNGMMGAVRLAVLRARGAGARSIAVMAFKNDDVSAIRAYLCRQGLAPSQLGITHAFDRLVELPDDLRAADARATAALTIDTIVNLVPGLEATHVDHARERLDPTSSRRRGAGTVTALLLDAADDAYTSGSAGFFSGVVKGVEALGAAGLHAPAQEEIRVYRTASAARDLEEQLAAFGRAVSSASHVATRAESGVLTMTFHQSKGREFDAVVIYDSSLASFNPTDPERVRLFYVALTRARRRWEFIATRGNETPLLDALGA